MYTVHAATGSGRGNEMYLPGMLSETKVLLPVWEELLRRNRDLRIIYSVPRLIEPEPVIHYRFM